MKTPQGYRLREKGETARHDDLFYDYKNERWVPCLIAGDVVNAATIAAKLSPVSGQGEAAVRAADSASTGGSVPSLAAPCGAPESREPQKLDEAPVVNLVCSAPVERFAALVRKLKAKQKRCVRIFRQEQKRLRFANASFYDGKSLGLSIAIDAIEYVLAANSAPAVGRKATSERQRATEPNS